MYDEILVCLDGSAFAERIMPYARGIAASLGAKVTILRVAEQEADYAAAESYVRQRAKTLGVEGKVRMVEVDTSSTLLRELWQNPLAIPALTTHGRTGLLESLMGSVALRIIRGAGRPVLLYRPTAAPLPAAVDAVVKITSVVATLDGSKFSEIILPIAAGLAKPLGAKLELVQVLPREGSQGQIPPELTRDVLESSYLHGRAVEVKRKHSVEVEWDVLHGNPPEAICNFVHGRRDVMLAMTSHARGGLERTIFGSVSSECVRRAGVPILIYWPNL